MKKPAGLLTAIGIGIGSMVGSGWLFSAYYAAKFIGPASFFSWFIGAGISLILALLLAEIASMFDERALFSRLVTISHENPDLGFIIALSGWLCLVLIIPTEAAATVRYLSTMIPSMTDSLITQEQHTVLGSACIILLVIIYSLLNYWGMHLLAKASNALAIIKVVVPVLTAVILMCSSFHPSNFVSQGFAPYGIKPIFSGVVVCGIFYTFYGFSLVAMFGRELENPQKSIPRALILSVLICFVIYCLLQAAFIGSMPPSMILQGWSNLHFTSPFVQLLMLVDLHVLGLWTMVLYFDATVSPSGAGMICLGSAARIVTGMAEDHQLPKFFNKIHPLYQISRQSLIITMLVCCTVLFIYKDWRELMILDSVFQLITCLAIPIAFTRLRQRKAHLVRVYRVQWGRALSFVMFLILSYFLTQVTLKSLLISLVLYVIFFTLYILSYYRAKMDHVLKACLSVWSIFSYFLLIILFAYLDRVEIIHKEVLIGVFFVSMSLHFYFLVNQKSYQ
ncbi:MAG: APC family permease [Legionellales bacterium]|nr:APC family permease [Legionellales bacterium]